MDTENVNVIYKKATLHHGLKYYQSFYVIRIMVHGPTVTKLSSSIGMNKRQVRNMQKEKTIIIKLVTRFVFEAV